MTLAIRVRLRVATLQLALNGGPELLFGATDHGLAVAGEHVLKVQIENRSNVVFGGMCKLQPTRANVVRLEKAQPPHHELGWQIENSSAVGVCCAKTVVGGAPPFLAATRSRAITPDKMPPDKTNQSSPRRHSVPSFSYESSCASCPGDERSRPCAKEGCAAFCIAPTHHILHIRKHEATYVSSSGALPSAPVARCGMFLIKTRGAASADAPPDMVCGRDPRPRFAGCRFRAMVGGVTTRVGFVLLAVGSTPGCAWPRATAQLEYTNSGPKECGDAEQLRQLVRDHLGYDPWDADAGRVVSVRIQSSSGLVNASTQLRQVGGPVAGSRKLTVMSHECRELARATALAVSLAIDPLRAADSEPPAEPDSRWRLSAQATIASGALPDVSGGGRLAGSWRLSEVSGFELWLGVDAFIEAPAATSHATGVQIEAWRTGIIGSLCANRGLFHACIIGEGAAVWAEGRGLVDAHGAWVGRAAAGLRAGLQIPIHASGWSFLVQVDGLAAVLRPVLTDHSDTVAFWTSPPFAVGASSGIVKTF